MTDLKIISALIGLCGAVGNNGKTENTDAVVRQALLSSDTEAAVSTVHKEKFTISPNCAVCASPCGNTSDYDIAKFGQDTKEIAALKEQIRELLCLAAEKDRDTELPEVVYRSIAYLGYDLVKESYLELIEEMQKWLDR